jgi:hypothetical protein
MKRWALNLWCVITHSHQVLTSLFLLVSTKVKVKLAPRMPLRVWGSGDIALLILYLELGVGEWSASRFSRITPEDRALSANWRDWIGLIADLSALKKSTNFCLFQDSNHDSSAVQRYKDLPVCVRRLIGSKFRIEDPEILGATVQNLVPGASCPGLVHPLF